MSRQLNKSLHGLRELGAKRVVDPDGWERSIRAAFKERGGQPPTVEQAADRLGVSVRTLWRYLHDKRLRDVARQYKLERLHTRESEATFESKNAPHDPCGLTELGALRRIDPKGWEKRIRQAYKRAGTIDQAAKLLDISTRQLQRQLAAANIDLVGES